MGSHQEPTAITCCIIMSPRRDGKAAGLKLQEAQVHMLFAVLK